MAVILIELFGVESIIEHLGVESRPAVVPRVNRRNAYQQHKQGCPHRLTGTGAALEYPTASLPMDIPSVITSVARPLGGALLVALSTLTCAKPLAAEEGLSDIVVTASRLNRSAAELSQTIETVSHDEITSLQAASVVEVLRQLPGTNVIQQGGRGGISSILLRGGEPNFNVVLIDGIQVNDPTNTRGGSYDLGALEQSQLEQVEVILGSMSPVYGSDALSGVVNFITRGPNSPSSINIEAGTQGYGSASAFFARQFETIGLGIGGNFTEDDGDVEGASYRSDSLHGRFTANFAGDGRAGLSFGFQDYTTTSFPEDSGGPKLALIRAVDQRDAEEARAGLQLSYPFADRWETGLWASVYQREESYVSPGIAPGLLDGIPPNSADTDFDRRQLRATLRTRLTNQFTSVIGAQWQSEEGKSIGELDFGFPLPTDFELDRDTLSAFAEASFDTGRFALQGGIRWDDPDQISSVVTGRLGVIYRLSDGLTELRANWGEGFKAPSFFALAHPLVGNPNLKSETGDSIDIGLRRRFVDGAASIDITLFRHEYENLIDFDPANFTNVNRDSVEASGAQTTVTYSPTTGIRLLAHLTWLDTDVKDTSTTLRGRPEWRGGGSLDWEVVSNWRWITRILALDDFYESSVPTGGVWLDGYVRMDTALNWQASDALSFGLAIDNLFDETYEEAAGFPAAGIRGRLALRYEF